MNLVVHHHHVQQHHDHVVVVQLKVQNPRSRAIIQIIIVGHHHHLIIQVHHHQNVVVIKMVLIPVNIFVKYVPAMLKGLNVSMVYLIIVIMFCKISSSLEFYSKFSFSCYECIVSWKRSKYSNAESERYKPLKNLIKQILISIFLVVQCVKFVQHL